MHAIQTNRLTKRYGKARGIEDIHLTVSEGEIFGFIGPNGAGKSTTIRTLLGFIRPTSGSAAIFGHDIVRSSKQIKQIVGYLPAEVNYYGDMRVRDLLAYSASFYGIDASSRMRELADLFELDLAKRIDDLSLGNKKKTAIVQSVLHSPKLLILDEPTSGLDPLMQKRFFDLIQSENDRGATVVFSSHILSEVQRMCSRVAIIKEGRLQSVENVEDMRGRAYKKVRIAFADPIDAGGLKLPGMKDVTIDVSICQFLYNGDLDVLIKTIAGRPITNLWLEEPSLEEIFMHYYES